MLQDYFREQARWRHEKAEEYPEDRRNAQSAAALESLAEYVEPDELGNAEADSQVLVELEKHLFEGFSLGGEETQRAVTRYGFGYRVTSWSHEEFLEELLALAARDAYEFVHDHGNDPTETLFAFEVEAARRDVLAPYGYFERRAGGKSTEGELREWLEREKLEERLEKEREELEEKEREELEELLREEGGR